MAWALLNTPPRVDSRIKDMGIRDVGWCPKAALLRNLALRPWQPRLQQFHEGFWAIRHIQRDICKQLSLCVGSSVHEADKTVRTQATKFRNDCLANRRRNGMPDHYSINLLLSRKTWRLFRRFR